MVKKVLVCLLWICTLGISFFELGSQTILANSNTIENPKPSDPEATEGYTSEWLEIKRLGPRTGVIMKDKPQIPGSYGDAYNLYITQPSTHTGWSVQLYACERKITHYDRIYQNGVLVEMRPRYQSTWLEADNFSTSNKNDSGMLSEYADQLQSLYGDMGRGIDWKSARGELWGVDYWSVYNVDTRTFNVDCQNGDVAFYYNNNDIIMEGRVQVDLEDPTVTKPAPNRTEGAAEGKAFWELRRYDDEKVSGVYIESSFTIAGDHYATRNPKHKLTVNGQTIEKESPIEYEIQNASDVKNKNMEYEFTYEYTNHYRDIYECVDSQDGYCYSWRFVERIPDWNYAQTFTLHDQIKMDHAQNDNVQEESLDQVLSKKWIVGRQDTYNPSKTSKAYYERYSLAEGNDWENNVKLKTQTTLPMTPGKLLYQVELPSGAHQTKQFYPLKKTQSTGTFTAVELDDSLQAEFAAGVQLQQKVMTDKGLKQTNRTFEAEFISDLFFTTHFTGFMSGYPYAEQVKQAIVNDQALPSFEEIVRKGTEKGVGDFEAYAQGVAFKDEWLFTESEETFQKLQRYSIPVNPYSELKPGVSYQNKWVLTDMGLNDLVFRFTQTFSFEHYLFGSGYDEAWIIEQPESRFPVGPDEYETVILIYEELEEIRGALRQRQKIKMHNFRWIDRTFPEQVQAIRKTN